MACSKEQVLKPAGRVFADIGNKAAAVQFWKLTGKEPEAWGIFGGKLCRLDTLPGFSQFVEGDRHDNKH